MRRSASFTVTIVFTSERKRTSFGAVGATISRVVHQMLAFCPGTSVASIVVWPFSEAREVISPGLMRTLVWSPGRLRVRRALPAAGTARVKDARPASMLKGKPASSVTAKSAVPASTAVSVPPSSSSGRFLPSCRASKIAMPVVSGTLVTPLWRISPCNCTLPSTDSAATWSLKSARFIAYGTGGVSVLRTG